MPNSCFNYEPALKNWSAPRPSFGVRDDRGIERSFSSLFRFICKCFFYCFRSPVSCSFCPGLLLDVSEAWKASEGSCGDRSMSWHDDESSKSNVAVADSPAPKINKKYRKIKFSFIKNVNFSLSLIFKYLIKKFKLNTSKKKNP